MNTDRFCKPAVFLVAETQLSYEGLERYLGYVGVPEFLEEVLAARAAGISAMECLTSLMAKMCYKSLRAGDNSNITRVRSIEDNVKQGIIATAHGSVLEHAWFSFIASNCSRVLTHELVRHRVGTSFSQTSGRYVRIDSLKIVWDDILDDCKDLAEDVLAAIEKFVYLAECRKGLRVPNPSAPDARPEWCFDYRPGPDGSWDSWIRADYERTRWVPNTGKDIDFDYKKMVTSAIRRLAPNGIANEIGFSLNARSLRHLLMLRTAPSSEWEIRYVFAKVYELVRERYPLFFHDAKVNMVRDLPHVYGMRTQPYEEKVKE